MQASVLDELRVLMYHPRYSSDGERGRRIASAYLGRELKHGQLGSLAENEVLALIAHLKEKLCDHGATAVRKAVEHFVNRL